MEIRLGGFDSARVMGDSARVVCRMGSNFVGIGVMSDLIGQCLQAAGLLDSARVELTSARSMLRYWRDKDSQAPRFYAGTLNNLGVLYRAMGALDSAQSFFEESATIEQDDSVSLALTVANIGAVRLLRGRLDSAEAAFDMAERLAGSDPQTKLLVQVDRAVALRDVGLVDSAAVHVAGAYRTARDLPDSADLSDLRALGASLDLARRQYRRAVDSLKVVVNDQHIQARSVRAENMMFLGLAYLDLQELDSARHWFRAAQSTAPSAGPVERALTELNLSVVERLAGSQQLAVRHAYTARAIYHDVRYLDGEALALENVAFAYQNAGPKDLRRASAYYDSASSLSHSVTAHYRSALMRLSASEQTADMYEQWILALLAPQFDERERALSILAVSERARLSDSDLTDNAQTGSHLIDEGSALVQRVREKGVDGLVYTVTEDTIVFVYIGRATVQTGWAAVNREALKRQIEVFRFSMDGKRPEVGPVPTAQAAQSAGAELISVVLPDVLRRQLREGRELIVVPYGPLGLLSYGALPIGDTAFVGTSFTLSYARSLNAFLRSGRALRPQVDRALVVGAPNPPRDLGLTSLAGARDEAQWLAQKIQVKARIGREATRDFMLRSFQDASLIHIAAHAQSYNSDLLASTSRIFLTPDADNNGLVTAADITRTQHIRADLVVLSGCETGTGVPTRSAGVTGLAEAFLTQGARAVLVTMWSIDDQATKMLVIGMYRHLLDDLDSPDVAESLRRAASEVRNTRGVLRRRRWQHPKYWAALQLVQ